MPTTEHSINDALATVLSATRTLWRHSKVVSSSALSKAGTLRDISEDIVRRIAVPSMLSWEYLSKFREIARHHVSYENWNEPLKVNEPYNGQGTYLYITKASLSRELPEQFQRNCAALLGTKVVLCDGAFL